MTAIAEQILANIFSRLGALAQAYEQIALYRDRGYNIGVDTLPALSLDDGGDSQVDDTRSFGVTFKTRDIVVQLRVESEDDDGIATAMNALYVQVSTIVLSDWTQGGVAIDTHDGGLSALVKSGNENTPNIGEAFATFHVDYQHATGRPDLLYS